MATTRIPFAATLLATSLLGCGPGDHRYPPPDFTAGSATGTTGGPGTGGAGGEGGDGVGGGSTTGTGTGTGTGGAAGKATLTQVLVGAPWKLGQQTTGIAADDEGRVYVLDDSHVFVVDGTTIDVYMTLDDVTAITGVAAYAFRDLDRDESGALYIVLEGFAAEGTVLKTTAAHQGVVYASGPDVGFMDHIGVASPDLIGLVSDLGGFWALDKGVLSQVYDSALLGGGTDCAAEDLAMQTSGVFLYQPGCNGSAIVHGNINGEVPYLVSTDVVDAWNYLCSARDPAGGFYVMTEIPGTVLPRLIHVPEDFNAMSAWEVVATIPDIKLAAQQEGDLLFDYCAMALNNNGTLFIQSFDQLWRVDF